MRSESGSICRLTFSAIVLGAVLTGLGAVVLLPTRAAQAQENADKLPAWRIYSICRSDSAVGQCKLYEAVARQQIVSSWTVIPPAWREACLLRFTPPLEPSWRILAACIDNESRRSGDARARDANAASRAEARRMTGNQAAVRAVAVGQASEEGIAREEPVEAEPKAEVEGVAGKTVTDTAARKVAAQTAARKTEDEARRKAEAENTARVAAAVVEAKRKAEAEEVARKAVAEAVARKAAAEAEVKRKAKAEEAARKTAAAAKAKRKAEAVKAARKAVAAAAAKRIAEAEAKAIAEEAAREAAEEARLTEEARVCRNSIRSIIARDPFTFETRRARLRKFARQQLDEVIVVALGCPMINFRIEGHTDSTGDEAANMGLSKMRAQTVVDYLTAGGVNAGRIRAVGFGQTRPAESNSTRKGRAANRRIKFSVE